MFENYWWLWMAIAALFIVGEIFTAGFFLLWFGVGAIVAGLLCLAGFKMVWQLAVFVILSTVLFACSRKLGNRVAGKQPGIGADRLVGEECLVLESIDSGANSGLVRRAEEQWRAVSATGETIAVGRRVKVVVVKGTRLVVSPMEEGG